MYSRLEDEANLVQINCHIDEMDDRIKSLKGLISTMAVSGQPTKNQSELLVNMLRLLKTMHVLRTDAVSTLNADPNCMEFSLDKNEGIK